MIFQTPEIYYAAACMVYVLSSLFCATLRWFHMCRPFDKHEEYFYPARRLIAFIFAGFAIQMPYIFRVDSADAWLLVRVFLVVFLPAAGMLAFKRYFFAEVLHRKLLNLFSAVLPLLLLLTLSAFAWAGGDTLDRYRTWVLALTGGYGLLLLAGLSQTTFWLRKQIIRFQHDEYSNEEDFPIQFATRVVFVPLVFAIVSWGIFFSDSRVFAMWLHLFNAVANVMVLVLILHPHRKEYKSIVAEADLQVEKQLEKQLENPPADMDLLCPQKKAQMTEAAKDELEKKIRYQLVERQLYLNPNLKMDDLVDAVESNRKYVSLVMNERFGSFFETLNNLRAEVALAYSENHPEATQEDIALHSGFGSVKTYRRNMEGYEKKKRKQKRDKTALD